MSRRHDLTLLHRDGQDRWVHKSALGKFKAQGWSETLPVVQTPEPKVWSPEPKVRKARGRK